MVDRREALRITTAVGTSIALGGGLTRAILRDAGLRRVRETRTRMGTVVTLTVVHPDGVAAAALVRVAFREMERLEALLTRHRSAGAVGRLNAAGRLEGPPPELVRVLLHAQEIAEASGGAFDVTIHPVLDLYERSFALRRRPPDDARIDAALARVGFRGLAVDGDVVRLAEPGMGITLDGIAKGYVVDRTVEVLVAGGASRVLVDAGGDMSSSGEGSVREPWTIAVQDPRHDEEAVGLVRLAGDAVATSGDYMRSFSNDRRHHHILDPRTGRSPEEISSVSVIAPSAMEADALSTALLVMGPERGVTLAEATAGAEALVIDKRGRRTATSGMRVAGALLALWGGLVSGTAASAQDRPAPSVSDSPTAQVGGLFDAHEPLTLTLRVPLSELRGDRRASPDRGARLVVPGASGVEREIEITVRTRGEFRLDPSNCTFPPLRLDIEADHAEGSLFEGQDELKLVSACRPGRERYEELVHLEYLVYRTYRLITDTSFRVRLARVRFVEWAGSGDAADDSVAVEASPESGEADTRWAFLIEDDEVLAARLGMRRFDLEEGRNLPAAAFDPLLLTQTALLEYMIGNTDWAAEAGHNVEILDRGGVAVPVPYDFDFAGIVDAPYAVPASGLGLESVRERRYRGWCTNPVVTRLALDAFRDARGSVLRLWQEAEGLSDPTRRRVVRYLESFYDDVETDERAERRFLRDCRVRVG